LKFDLNIVSKGFEEEGSLILTNTNSALPKNYSVLTKGELDTIKAYIYTTGYKTHVNDEIYTYARQRLLQTGQKIKFILDDNKYIENSVRNKGASMALVAYYDNVTLCGCASGVKKTVPLIGKEAADKIVGYLAKDFSIDSENAALLLPFLCLTKKSEFVINKTSDKFNTAKAICEILFNKKIEFDKETRVVTIS
jgi:RNA 3'-terminal phosphate cyclase